MVVRLSPSKPINSLKNKQREEKRKEKETKGEGREQYLTTNSILDRGERCSIERSSIVDQVTVVAIEWPHVP